METIEALARDWEAFKVANDARLKEIEKRGHADPLLEEKVNKTGAGIEALQKTAAELQKQVDDCVMKAQRKVGGDGDASAAKLVEDRKSFEAWFKKQDLKDFARVKAVSTDSGPAGGWAIPETINSTIVERERNQSPMRALCSVTTATDENYFRLVNLGGATYGWVGETEARPETTAPTFQKLHPAFGEVYANPATTQRALDAMSVISAEQWLANEVAIGFSEGQNAAFTSGTGVKKPKGILSYTLSTSVDGTRSDGQIQYVASGTSNTWVADTLLATMYALKQGYMNGSAWVMSRLGQLAVMKLKGTQNDHYLWQPSIAAGQPATLLGFPVYTNDDMPALQAGANAAIFGNFKRGYEIVDVPQSMSFLRDPFTNKPYVQFYSTKLVGGHVIDDRALKVYQLT